VTPIYAVGYRLGIHLFAETAVPEATHFLGQLTSLSKGFFLGNMITAVVVAIFCYLAVYGLLTVKKVRLSQ
jgi:uncharacterized protein (DUF2062 family)